MKSYHSQLRSENILTTHAIAAKVLSCCATLRDNGEDSHMSTSIQAP